MGCRSKPGRVLIEAAPCDVLVAHTTKVGA